MAKKWKGYLGGSTLISLSPGQIQRNLASGAEYERKKRERAQKKFDKEHGRSSDATLRKIEEWNRQERERPSYNRANVAKGRSK